MHFTIKFLLKQFKKIYLLLLVLAFSCSSNKEEKQVQLFNSYCASCHIAPAIDALPKHLWDTKILPEMAARMGIKENAFNQYQDMDYEEMHVVFKSGIYPSKPVMSLEDWSLLRNYIVNLAPDSIPNLVDKHNVKETNQFNSKQINIDNRPGTFITYLNFQSPDFIVGELNGNLTRYNYATENKEPFQKLKTAVIDYTQKNQVEYFTEIGILNPSELARGVLYQKQNNTLEVIVDSLHRPVYTQVIDVNKDGEDEILVSEFGHLTGQFSMLVNEKDTWRKKELLKVPGVIKSEITDFNNDGRDDIVVLSSQGDESITVLFQKDDLEFQSQKLIRFSPVYGTSWFELVDFNKDGFLDIITVHGDNADKTYFQKPYHGLRIHLNDGENNFEESFFYSLNGATRFVVDDFDADGDFDFGVISTFPDYENNPELAFVYLENTTVENVIKFQTQTIESANDGRWLLMDSGDFDNDGDQDIVLSAFSYSFTPVPNSFAKRWQENNLDLLVLENKLID